MPRYIDHHDQLSMPPADQIEALRARVNAPADASGVKGVNIFFASDGSGDCIFDAPSEATVIHAHEAGGFPAQAATIRQIAALV